MKGWVYVLKSQKNGRYYVGSSVDPEKRLHEKHNTGRVKATKLLKPWVLVFKQEYVEISLARRIERKIKKMKSKVILEKIIKDGCCKLKLGQ